MALKKIKKKIKNKDLLVLEQCFIKNQFKKNPKKSPFASQLILKKCNPGFKAFRSIKKSKKYTLKALQKYFKQIYDVGL